ncbi:MAG: histidine kinase [Rhodothermia bacterium]|nr:histidine kinase [Rhodothermia bacterium]
MSHRVMDILLVSSPYESFILSEDGQLSELLVSQFLELNLYQSPGIARLSNGASALALARSEPRFNLIITTANVGDMNAAELAREVKESRPNIPVVLLAFNNRELANFLARNDTSSIDRIFLWQGDVRILVAIVKSIEDTWNADVDCDLGGVQVVLVVEDSIKYYSSFLPIIYTEVVDQSQRLISEGVNLSHKILRMRARPKILLATSFEEAWGYFRQYSENILGIISDVEFPRSGEVSKTAGLELARQVKKEWPDVPILLQSSRTENDRLARTVGADFLVKGSPTLLTDLRRFMLENFGFGDFIFRTPEGVEMGRARDLRSLEKLLRTVPASSVAYHGERNHFSKWLKARTEFELAHRLRPRKVSDFATVEDLRDNLVESIAAYRRDRHRGIIADFDADNFDAVDSFSRIGGGSLGGKARGLAYARHMLSLYWDEEKYPGVRIAVPSAVVLGTDVFDRFLKDNDLRDFAMNTADDRTLVRKFMAARFPDDVKRDLRTFLEHARYPVAVRSSSILEDSQYQPFSGVYETFMLGDTLAKPHKRLRLLLRAIKKVYASTFSVDARAYLEATPYRLEEEKMAVVIQRIVGARHGDYYYPSFAGVARSYNFYPTGPMLPEDGIVSVALGMGKSVVDDGSGVRFCPRYPRHPMPFTSIRDILDSSQRRFWALPVDGNEMKEERLDIEAAGKDGTLARTASSYDIADHTIADGTSRPGIPVVTFAPILKHDVFPLAEITRDLLAIAEKGMAHPVEIEFAVDMDGKPDEPHEFAFLQMRPLVVQGESVDVDITVSDSSTVLCNSSTVLGSGRIEDVCDVLVVDPELFDRAGSRKAATEIARLNSRLVREGRKYLLIGVGRLGSTDPWLGIPVKWNEISGARVIVEAGFRDLVVPPSQGTHFFQNLVSFQVGYFTIDPGSETDFVDWDWLQGQDDLASGEFVRHLRFDDPVAVRMNGVEKQGLILKPGQQ